MEKKGTSPGRSRLRGFGFCLLLALVCPQSGCGDFTLFGEDGGSSTSPTATIVLSTTTPLACLSELVVLNGSGSSDPEGRTLSYAWSFSQRPTGSTAAILNGTQAQAAFTPDKPGDYKVQLTVTVSDGSASGTDVKTVTAGSRPLADAQLGTNEKICTSDSAAAQPVALTGTGSKNPASDCQNQGLTYAWTVILNPQGASPHLLNDATVTPSLQPDKMGAYRIKLEVEANSLKGDDTVDVSVVPVADAGDDQEGQTGVEVALDGTQSLNPVTCTSEGLVYTWELTQRPVGSAAILAGADTARPTFVPDLAGAYVVKLTVEAAEDTKTFTAQDTATVTVPVALEDLTAGNYTLVVDSIVDGVFQSPGLVSYLPVGTQLPQPLDVPATTAALPVTREVPIEYAGHQVGTLTLQIDRVNAENNYFTLTDGSINVSILGCTVTAAVQDGTIVPESPQSLRLDVTLGGVTAVGQVCALAGLVVEHAAGTIQMTFAGTYAGG